MDKFPAALLLGAFVLALAIIAICALIIRMKDNAIDRMIWQENILKRFFTLLEWKMRVSTILPSPAKTDEQLEQLRDILQDLQPNFDCVIATLAGGDSCSIVNWEAVDELVTYMELKRGEYKAVTLTQQSASVAT